MLDRATRRDVQRQIRMDRMPKKRPHRNSIGGLARKQISGKAQVFPYKLTWRPEPRKKNQRIFLLGESPCWVPSQFPGDQVLLHLPEKHRKIHLKCPGRGKQLVTFRTIGNPLDMGGVCLVSPPPTPNKHSAVHGDDFS